MARGLQATKRRIRSVKATRKITKAMELVATAKLKKTKDRLAGVKVYTDEVMDIVAHILSKATEAESPYFVQNDSPATLYIVITSSMGLCGGYNSNLLKYFMTSFNKATDAVMTIGLKGDTYLKNREVKPTEAYLDDSTGYEYYQAKVVAKEALHLYSQGAYGKICLVYTRFVNSVTFQPVISTLLPVDKDQFQIEERQGKLKLDTLFEPNATEIINTLIPMYFESTLYGRLVEAHVSEQASRRMAMENATDNADEIIEKLLLDYNKARQAAITQEISEIVAGANA